MRRLHALVRVSSAALALAFALATIGLALFRYDAWHRESQTNRAAAPASGRFVDAGDVKVFIQEAGPLAGPAVLLAHGMGAWSETWRATLSALGDAGFHAIAIDAPPFGFSDRPETGTYDRHAQAERILHLLDTLGLHQAIFVGHSFGARAVVTAALAAPQRVRHLILVDPALGLTEGGEPDDSDAGPLPLLLDVSWVRNALVAATFANPRLTRTLVESFVADPVSVTDEIVAIYQQPMVVSRSTECVGDWLRDFLSSTDRQLVTDVGALGRTGITTSLIWGEKDTVTPIWQAEMLVKEFRSAQLRTLPGVGHIPHLEATRAFNALLIEIVCAVKDVNCPKSG